MLQCDQEILRRELAEQAITYLNELSIILDELRIYYPLKPLKEILIMERVS